MQTQVRAGGRVTLMGVGPPGYEEVLQEGMASVYADDICLLSDREMGALEGVMNDWLGLYAARYGVDSTVTYTLRETAELLLDTANIADVTQILTGVPQQ